MSRISDSTRTSHDFSFVPLSDTGTLFKLCPLRHRPLTLPHQAFRAKRHEWNFLYIVAFAVCERSPG